MIDTAILSHCRVVRLNAELFPVSDGEAALWRKHRLTPIQVEANTPDEIIRLVADCDALFAISVALPEAVIGSLDRCRIISRMGVGTDKIDVKAATRRGIVVSNVPDFCLEEQADHAMALLLSLARKIPDMTRAMQEGAWLRARKLAWTNQRLAGRVLGLIGFGGSARAVARRATGFGMRILATRRRLGAPSPEAEALGVRIVDLDTLLAESDYVSLHLPLNETTHHLLDDAALRLMKPSAYLINVARGAIVDEMALVAALRERWLAGAGLDTYGGIDVFAEEHGPSDHPLLELGNVVLTPHVAAESVQARRRVQKVSVENMVAVLTSHWPRAENIVNPTVVPRVPLADHDPSLFEE